GIPYIGWVKIFLTESGMLIPLLVIVSALLIISIVRDVIKGEHKEEEKDAEENKEELSVKSQKEE
ncbi:MAG: hypothetical protein ACXABG_00210, partial [Promethearchaeota archaeon]